MRKLVYVTFHTVISYIIYLYNALLRTRVEILKKQCTYTLYLILMHVRPLMSARDLVQLKASL
jgi:hypothetical protein